MGTEGFSRESALLYHRCSPSAILGVDARGQTPTRVGPTADGRSAPGTSARRRPARAGRRPRHRSPGAARQRRRRASPSPTQRQSPLYRSAVGDELVYVHDGNARLDSVFGRLTVEAGDYVVVPAGTTHRWIVPATGAVGALVIESSGHVASPTSTSRRTASCSNTRRTPSATCASRPIVDDDSRAASRTADVPVLVRNPHRLDAVPPRHHPFDVVGWDGCVYPYAFNIGDFEPIVGRCTSRRRSTRPSSCPAPSCARSCRGCSTSTPTPSRCRTTTNTDSDEVLFYSAGNFMSRAGSGIDVGSISYHPAGFVHGPQPGHAQLTGALEDGQGERVPDAQERDEDGQGEHGVHETEHLVDEGELLGLVLVLVEHLRPGERRRLLLHRGERLLLGHVTGAADEDLGVQLVDEVGLVGLHAETQFPAGWFSP
jgi:homogentisate 1,2-dioxygenase